jgi:cysteine desulfuration protein SufE
MTINEVQDQIIEEFSLFPDWMEKYEYILDLGKSLPQIDDKYKTDSYLVPGCQSKSWLHVEMVGDKVAISADSDALIGKGIIALLIRVLSNNTAEEIIQSDLYFLDNMGLQENLSMNRASGLESMISKIMLDVEAIRT